MTEVDEQELVGAMEMKIDTYSAAMFQRQQSNESVALSCFDQAIDD